MRHRARVAYSSMQQDQFEPAGAQLFDPNRSLSSLAMSVAICRRSLPFRAKRANAVGGVLC
jgi:hypothetical protein